MKELQINGAKRYVDDLERDVYVPTQLVINLNLDDDHKPSGNCRFSVKKAPITDTGVRFDLAVVDPKIQKISMDLSDAPQVVLDYFESKILAGFVSHLNPQNSGVLI